MSPKTRIEIGKNVEGEKKTYSHDSLVRRKPRFPFCDGEPNLVRARISPTPLIFPYTVHISRPVVVTVRSARQPSWHFILILTVSRGQPQLLVQ